MAKTEAAHAQGKEDPNIGASRLVDRNSRETQNATVRDAHSQQALAAQRPDAPGQDVKVMVPIRLDGPHDGVDKWTRYQQIRAAVAAHDPHPLPASMALEIFDFLAQCAGITEPDHKKV